MLLFVMVASSKHYIRSYLHKVIWKLPSCKCCRRCHSHLIISCLDRVLTGLSIRRYESFHECPSFNEIKSREEKDTLEKKWGVHILFKQAADGSVIIGDSHEYADVKDMDDLGYDIKEDINAFMLAEARKIVDLPTYEIQRQWFGIYSQCKTTMYSSIQLTDKFILSQV